jgi:hypothetical protein
VELLAALRVQHTVVGLGAQPLRLDAL